MGRDGGGGRRRREMGQIRPSDYPFIEIGEGLTFSDDPPEGSIGIKPFLDMVNRAQRMEAGMYGNPPTLGRVLDTDKLVGSDASGLSPRMLLDAFKDGETGDQIGKLVGLTFLGLPSSCTIDFDEYPQDERYGKSEFAGFFPGLQKRTWQSHPYVYGATYDDPTVKEEQTFACFMKGQPLWHAPFAAMKSDLDTIKAVETYSYFSLHPEAGFPYGDDEGFYDGETFIGKGTFARKTDDECYWNGESWVKYSDGTEQKADNYNGAIDWQSWLSPLDERGTVSLADIFDTGVIMAYITEYCEDILQPDGTSIDTVTRKCKIMPFTPLEQSRGWGLYEPLVSEFGDITMPAKPTLPPSMVGARWMPHASVNVAVEKCLLKIREE